MHYRISHDILLSIRINNKEKLRKNQTYPPRIIAISIYIRSKIKRVIPKDRSIYTPLYNLLNILTILNQIMMKLKYGAVSQTALTMKEEWMQRI